MTRNINLNYYTSEELEDMFFAPAKAVHPKTITAEKKAKKEAYAALKAEKREEAVCRKTSRKMKRS